MAEIVTVAVNDTISKILTAKRNVKHHEIPLWLDKLRKLNPHISNLDRIFPNEKILIPSQLHETVPPYDVWGNVFSHIPPSLNQSPQNYIYVYPAGPGDSIDSIAQQIFAGGRHQSMPLSTKRALLLHNNPVLKQHLGNKILPAKMILDATPAKVAQMDKVLWENERPHMGTYIDRLDPAVKDFYQQTGPDQALFFAKMVQQLRETGASIGMDDVVKGASYGVGGWSGLAASGTISLSNVNALAQELYAEAVQKFGKEVVASKKANHLAQMQKFFTSHPKYQALMSHLKKLPEHLLPKGKVIPTTSASVNSTIARHMRKQFFLADLKPGLATRMGTVARGLNGKLTIVKGLGRHATWYIPAVLGVMSVANASPEMRMRTLFAEGFGVIGGAIGTWVGAEMIGAGIVSALCLGPFGAFLLIFILGAGIGIIGNELFKKFGSRSYDIGDRFSGQVYHSIDNLVEAF